jgi:hypothetical protein
LTYIINLKKGLYLFFGKKKYSVFLSLSLFALLVTSCAGTPSETQLAKAPQQAKNQTNQSQSAVIQKSNTNPITQAAVNAGVLSAAKTINQVISYLTTGTKSGAYLFIPQNQPDRRLFSTSLELISKQGDSMYATASFFPNKEAVYDTVQYLPKASKEVRATIFKNIKNEKVIKENIIILDAGNLKIFLLPAGKRGCIVIKKQVLR